MVAKYDIASYLGKTFGSWTVIADLGVDETGHSIVKCRCSCGNEKIHQFSRLMCGKTHKCKECDIKRLNKESSTHGLSHEPLYLVYNDMKQRCYNPENHNYKYYGAKGVTVCDEWRYNFKSFYDWAMMNGYKKGLTIDRKDVKGNYCPENSRWVTWEIQSTNKNIQINNTSGYIGIYLKIKKSSGRKWWASTVAYNYKIKVLGYYKTQKEALDVRNKFIIDNNLPHKIQEYRGETFILDNPIKPRSTNHSGYSGIHWQKNIKKWCTRITINHKRINLGYYKTQKEALDIINKYIIDNKLDYPIQEYKGEIGSVNKE